jgi:hypothetical protein
MKKLQFISLIFYCLFFFSCINPKDNKTSMEITDNNRHYYPIITGQHLTVSFKVKNTGNHPLLISDIITSCGCLVLDRTTIKTISAGNEGFINLTYDSSKNIGYAKHWIEVYGNFINMDKMDLVFDLNVVPNNLYTKDYEELYAELNKTSKGFSDFVDGKENNKGYYLSSDGETQ